MCPHLAHLFFFQVLLRLALNLPDRQLSHSHHVSQLLSNESLHFHNIKLNETCNVVAFDAIQLTITSSASNSVSHQIRLKYPLSQNFLFQNFGMSEYLNYLLHGGFPLVFFSSKSVN